MAVLEIALLGYPTISLNGQQIQQDIPDKAIALLSFIALTGQTHRRDALAGMLWGNKREQRARNSLSIVLNKLRKHAVLETHLQVSRREVGLVDPDQVSCDVTTFTELAARPAQQTLEQLEAAAALYGGAFLQGFRPNDDDGTRDFLTWAQQQQVRLEQLALDLFTTLVSRHRDAGNLAKAITYAQRVLTVDPLMESAQRDLMLLLAQNGQSEQAIAQYQDCCRVLEDELGIEPDDATRALYEEILESRNNGQPFTQTPVEVDESLHDRMPMRPYDVLFGRKAALAQLIDHLTTADTGWLTNLYGIGGLGKSSLAHMAVHHLIENEQISQLAWIEVESASHIGAPLSSDMLFETIIHKLVTAIPSIPASAPTHKQRVRQVRKALQADPWLVVIDNIEQFDDDGTLSEQLFALANPGRFLIVSRIRINAVRPVHALALDPIDRESAETCIRTRANALGLTNLTTADDALFEHLYKLVGGHPQALLLFVQTAAYISSEEILSQYALAEVQTIEQFYDDIYTLIWSALSPEARQLLDAMRLAPTQGMDEKQLATICGLTRNSYWQAARELTNAALLRPRSEGGVTYQQMHSLTNSFLHSLEHKGQRSDVAKVQHVEQIDSACTYWQAQLETMDVLAFEAAHPYLIKLIDMGLRRPETYLVSAELAAAYRMPMYTSMHWREWLPIYTQALAVTPDSDARLKMTLLSATGLLYDKHVDPLSATRQHQQAIEIAENLKDPTEIARHNVNLTLAYLKNRDLELAEQHIQIALDIVDELGIKGSIAVAAFRAKADIAHALTHFDDAISFCERAIRYAGNTQGAIVNDTYNTWANALFEISRFEEAKSKYLQSRALAQQAHDQGGVVVADIGLLDYYLVIGDVENARTIVESRNFELQDSLLSPHVSAHIAELTGRYYLLVANFSEAMCYFKKAIPYWEESKLSVDLGKTYALLAFTQKMLGTNKNLVDYTSKATSIFAVGGLYGKWVSKRFPMIDVSGNEIHNREGAVRHPPWVYI